MSRTTAIYEYCKGCIYDPKAPGTYREQVENCPSGPSAKVPCPLWPYRPVTLTTGIGRRTPRDKTPNTVDVDALIAGLDNEENE